MLGGLLRGREELLSTLDRVAALNGTARLLRESIGAHSGFVAELTGPEQAVIRWMSGNRTDALQDLTVPIGQGIGGRVLALSESSPERALPVELAEHCRSFQARCGVPARFVQLAPVPRLDAERTGLLVAAAREGLLNVEKHADALFVVVSLLPSDEGVQVVVADDGTGHPAEEVTPGTGMGLRALAERAARLGGRVSLVRDGVSLLLRYDPALILLDLRLPDMLAPEVIDQLRRVHPAGLIVVFTAHGCLLKDVAGTDLVAALRRVLRGEGVVDPRIFPDDGERSDALARNTVKTYLQSALHKLGARNRVEAIGKASEAGLL